MLNNIRSGKVNDNDLEVLNNRVINQNSDIPSEAIILSPTNKRGFNKQSKPSKHK